ncbi:MAG: hypothetical protein PHQ58_21225 [Rhodoferax sp.]|uniref:hypothetical protein n=1 Tax=Rhodoferax sp. TaxID=50421 RepID=UPI0026287A72|nr:hypothetical protein [Rhodoferax sp.]MDD2882941.1 hypothetical protein [Rhodoferax sp.]
MKLTLNTDKFENKLRDFKIFIKYDPHSQKENKYKKSLLKCKLSELKNFNVRMKAYLLFLDGLSQRKGSEIIDRDDFEHLINEYISWSFHEIKYISSNLTEINLKSKKNFLLKTLD